MAGERLDISSEPAGIGRNPRGQQPGGRRFVGVRFVCCEVYTRVYINADETAYEGNCPRCAKPVRLRIGPGGTNERFFTAG